MKASRLHAATVAANTASFLLIALLIPPSFGQTTVDLFDATDVTMSMSGRYVFREKTATVYCAGWGTAYVKTDNGDGTLSEPIVDNYMTAGNDNASICSGGSPASGVSGTHCFARNITTTQGIPATSAYNSSGVLASVNLTDGENKITFKLWDYGVVYANSKLVLELPSNCSNTSVINISIDIKPGSYPNSVNLCGKGVVTVAILGSDSFDVGYINLDTLMLGTTTPRLVGKGKKSNCSFEDVSGDFSVSQEGAPDGYLDLVCQYETVDLGDLSGHSSATVKGQLLDGTQFEGTDTINIVKDVCP